MSYLANEDILCTHCQFLNTVEVWSIVNVQEDPELKDLLLGGELNMAECSACKKVFYAEHFLLYHDPTSELIAFVYPYEDRVERVIYEEKTKVDFQLSQESLALADKLNYSPLTLFGLDELVKVIEMEEEVSIQSEIVSALAPSLNLNVKKIKPSVARRQNIPPVLPFLGDQGELNQQGLIRALEAIGEENNLLSVYSKFYERIKDSQTLEVSFE